MRKTSLHFIRYSLAAILLLAPFLAHNAWLINSSAENVALTEINHNQSPAQVQNSFGSLPVFFEENRGQHNSTVRYLTRGGSTTMFLTATEAVYVLRRPRSSVASPNSEDENNQPPTPNLEPPAERAVALYMRLADANPNAAFVGQEQLAHLTNYFKGSDSREWQTEIANYGRVSVENIYDGVDMIWHGKEAGEIQYDFLVAPNANPNCIKWEIEGAEQVSVEADGSLLIETEVGVMKQGKPFSYQETADNLRQEVGSRWSVVRRNTVGNQSRFSVGFEIDNYDGTKTLVIDPTVTFSSLAYSTFLGGAGFEGGSAIAVDGAGNAYITGSTSSTAFPTVAGGFDTTQNGAFDVFVSKLNADGSGLVYSTFLGGSSNDDGRGIAVDTAGNAYLTGDTTDDATDYPTTAGAFDTTHNGGDDAFVSKLNATGSALTFSTFLGGSGTDLGSGIAVDTAGNAYLTGFTVDATTNYPTTAGAFDTTHNGGFDAFVTKLNATGSALAFSTFLGGSSNDLGNGIAVDSAGNAYLTGYTNDGTTDYPTTTGAFDTTHNGLNDAFATKLNATGSTLTYSTFLGGSGCDVGRGIAVDTAGNAYLTGETIDSTTDYPTTAGAFDTTHNGGQDVFATKLNATGSALTYSTFLGGSDTDFGLGIAVDTAGNAYLTGNTTDSTTDYPTTPGAFDTTHNGGTRDAFATKLNATGSALDASTFLGGGRFDSGNGITVDTAGNAYLTGGTDDAMTTDYPTTTGAFDTTHNGGSDAFVTKLSDEMPTPTPTPTPQGFESDVAARPNGDGSILSDDVVQIRRFLNGTNTPSTMPNEFQRADADPFATRGDGSLNSADVVQTRRYQNGTSPMQTAGGPTMPGSRPEFLSAEVDKLTAELKPFADEMRQLRVENTMTTDGQTVTVNILVNAVGDEAEYGFTLNYDASVLSKPIIGIGNTTATVRACNTKIAGAINCSVGGFATNNLKSIDAGIGEILAGENRILLTVQFTVVGNAPSGETEIKLSKVNAASDAPQLLTVVGTPTNAVVNSPTFTPGTFNPVVITFSVIDPTQPVDFKLRAASTFHAANIRARCAIPPNEPEK